MAKLVKKTVLAVKTETTQGTPVSPAATDFLLAEDTKLEPVFEALARDYGRSSLDPVKALVGKRAYKLTFRTEVKGSGTKGTAYTPLGALLQALGFVETATPATSVVYAPTSSAASASFYGPGKSCTVEAYIDGVKHILSGCLGTGKFLIESGKRPMLEVELQGLYSEPTDAAAGTQTYNATLPEVIKGATFTVQSLSAVISKLEIDLGNKVVERMSAAATTSLLGFMITDRDPKATCDPEMETVATHNFFNKLTTAATGTLQFTLGSTAGNILDISCPAAQYTGLKYGSRNGIVTLEPNIQLNQSSGDDAITITFT